MLADLQQCRLGARGCAGVIEPVEWWQIGTAADPRRAARARVAFLTVHRPSPADPKEDGETWPNLHPCNTPSW